MQNAVITAKVINIMKKDILAEATDVEAEAVINFPQQFRLLGL